MRIFIAFLVLLAVAVPGGLYAYKYVVGGDVYDFIDYFSEPYEISSEDLLKLYEAERPGLIAGYQKHGNAYAMAYTHYKIAAALPAKPGVHSDRYLMTYVNDIGYDEYVKYGAGPMPVGTIIAKEAFKLRPNGEFLPYSLFIMEKVSAEDAPETDGWVYARVLYDGTTGLPASQEFCHSCHKAYAHQDSLGYPVREARLKPAGASSEPVQVVSYADVAPGDLIRGEELAQSCLGCHQVGPDAKNFVGPVLSNVYGRQIGSYPGFGYSDGVKALGDDGRVWNEALLFGWLEGPSDFLREQLDDPSANSRMFFQLENAQDRADVIAYLKSQSASAE